MNPNFLEGVPGLGLKKFSHKGLAQGVSTRWERREEKGRLQLLLKQPGHQLQGVQGQGGEGISIQPFSAPLKVQNLASASALVCLAFIVVM